MRRRTTLSTAIVLALGLGVSNAHAQSATIQALATVLTPITVTGARNLDFGTVFPGINKTIGVTAATSGRFDATGTALANVDISFTLPTNLVSGANNLAISTWTGCWNPTANNASVACTAFTPSGAAVPVNFGVAGSLWVFVGATVAPTAGQATGSYSANVQMTLAYF
jgi:hypothetical protein